MAAIRGGLTDAVKGQMNDRDRVVKPAASMARWTSPTDRQQTGHTGTNKIASACSARSCSMISGTVRVIRVSARGW